MKILIVEDEHPLADALTEILKQQKYSVDAVYNGADGLEYALTGIYDIILLDIMLPKIDGLEVLRRLRAKRISTPILLLTAKSLTSDKVAGLDCGADDYLTKPFATQELLARIRALTRRIGEFTGDELRHGNTALDKNAFELKTESNSVKLAPREFQLMEVLMSNVGRIVQKERIIEKIWGYDSDAEYNSVEVYISFIRKKLSHIGSDIQIKAVRGIGYSIEIS